MEEKIGSVIQKLRLEKNMSVQELASKSNMTVIGIKNIESNLNEPFVKSLKAISEALDCDFDYLFQFLKK